MIIALVILLSVLGAFRCAEQLIIGPTERQPLSALGLCGFILLLTFAVNVGIVLVAGYTT